MASSKLSETLIGREVERLFDQISARHGDLCWNPVTGEEFVYGVDPIKKQKEAAYRRLLVRDYFALNSPADAYNRQPRTRPVMAGEWQQRRLDEMIGRNELLAEAVRRSLPDRAIR